MKGLELIDEELLERLARLVVGLRNQPRCGVKHAVHQA